MRTAATRTLGIFLAVFAGGVLIHGFRSIRTVDDIDATAVFAISTSLLLAIVIGWLGSIAFRRATALSSAVIVTFAGLAAATAAFEPRLFAPDLAMSLTPRQREAFHYLMTAGYLQGTHIGIGGSRSGGYLAMRVLSRSSDADAAFKSLVLHGTVAGQLYGLAGVRRTDPLFFRANAWRCARRRDTIDFIQGCVMQAEPIATIVSDPRAVQLPRGMSAEEWFRTHWKRGQPLYFDIAGGGYSSMFLDREPWPKAETDAQLDEKLYDFVNNKPWDPRD
jgi:hypothetical protein